MEFIASKPLTVGVELEFQLLDKDSLDLVNGISSLMERYPGSPYIKPEFIQNTIEVASRIGENVADVHQHFRDITRTLTTDCIDLDMLLCAAGTHPFSLDLALFTPLPRYQRLENSTGLLGRTQVTYATHVHVGVQTGEEVIYLLNAFSNFLPLLLALSATSPFWRAYDTGYVSYRHRILAASRNYGLPPRVDNWENFCKLFYALQKAEMLKTINDVHWDIRPRPHLGTVEIRIMDAQSSLQEAMELAALVRILAGYLLKHRDDNSEHGLLPRELPWWIEKENCFAASRLGLDANYIYRSDGAFRPMLEMWQYIAEKIQSYAKVIGEDRYLQSLAHRVQQRNLGCYRQRKMFQDTGSAKDVAASLVRELEHDLEKKVRIAG